MPLEGRYSKYVEVIRGLKKRWRPHPGQLQLGVPLFNQGQHVFGQCGRNFGKTDFLSYSLWRWANLYPNSENYYFAPYQKQAKEIVWASRRIQNFGPKEWIANVNNSELRITFTNGSFIKVDGSDNVDSYRGIKPKGLSVLDEFKDFRPEFYIAYDPNLAAYKSPMLIMGTPPDRECQFLEVAEEFRQNPNRHFFKGPTHLNPHIDKEWLDAKKTELLKRGEGDVWEREYLAEYVPGGVSKIFPMLDRSLVKPYDKLWHDKIRRDAKKLDWIIAADPAASTVFGVLFGAINPYTKEIFILDEIYEDDQRVMSVKEIGSRIIAKRDEIFPYKEWVQVYDEASTWFMNEMLDRFEEHFGPTQKHLKKKEDGLSLIKDAMLQGKLFISDRCVKLFWELDNYYKDKTGKIPKVDDHLIDCLRYLLGAAYYELESVQEYKEDEDERFRGARISDDFAGLDDFGMPTEEWSVE